MDIFTQNITEIAAFFPDLLTTIEDTAKGMVTAATYYERHGIRADLFDDDDPQPEKESDDVRYGGKENQTDA